MLQVWRGNLPKDLFVAKSAERILFCGWRRDMEDMIMVILQGIYASTDSIPDFSGIYLLGGRQVKNSFWFTCRDSTCSLKIKFHFVVKKQIWHQIFAMLPKGLIFFNFITDMLFSNMVLGIGCLFSSKFRVMDVQ